MLDLNSNTKILYTHEDPEGLILYDCKFDGVEFKMGDENTKRSLSFWGSKLIQKKIMQVKILSTVIEKYEKDILHGKTQFKKVENPKSFKRVKETSKKT